MSSHRIKMRLMGTETDIEKWLWLMQKMNERGLIEILETSNFYPNRGDSKLYRTYLEIDLTVSEDS